MTVLDLEVFVYLLLCPNIIRNISGYSVSSFKYQLDKPLNTIPDIPCVANHDNSLENSSHTSIHLFNGVHPV